ncbi:3-oxoacyl-(acyl-carrier protein) reductase [Hyphomicrobiales bacterium]|nr:3-oxoacyl-(acyl-carrier protein) reductase [Hyphomicrobiales bacterium]CAH1695656.1 3-oxoacyl-(acyl-carrier protein) reductase [Hyphomicrobiales bacterium]
MDFSGKVVLITGGASGIGGATTRAFAQAGAKVAFTYITSEKEARAIEAECDAHGQVARGYKADMSKPDEVAAIVASTEREFGPIDVLFANAGGLLRRARCVESSLELWQEAFSINVFSTFLVVQAVLKSMEPRGSGAIVMMSSLAAFDGGGLGASHYASSKAAVATFIRALAKEVGPSGIRVNGVAPGLIGTRFHDTFNTPQGRAAAVERTPLRREGVPQDVADAVLFLASDRASYITGEITQINGGVGF